MSKKESHTTEVSQAELELLEAMRTAPGLTPQITAMLKGFEAETEQGMDAYQAELHAVELTRKLGGLLLKQWGEQTQEEQSRQSSLDPNLIKHGKKLSWQSTFGPINIERQVFKKKSTGVTSRPFLDYAKLSASGCSLLLKRRLVDFSSERSMEDSAKALKEHYGVKLSSTVINKVTQEAGRAAKEFNADAPSFEESVPLLVVEIDGSMVPIVEYGEASGEQKQAGKKHDRSCFWKEFRLCTVSLPGKVGTRYGVTDGPPFEAGCMMYQICQYEGMDEDTQIHGVADGAPWIAEQFEEQFGTNHKFYIDFYHTSEYLGNVSKELTANDLVGGAWYEQQ